MQPLDKMNAREWLGVQGVVPASWIDSVIDAFDFSAPAPEIRQFDTGDVIYQYTSNPSFYNAARMQAAGTACKVRSLRASRYSAASRDGRCTGSSSSDLLQRLKVVLHQSQR